MGKTFPVPCGVAIVSVQQAQVWQLSLIAYKSSVAYVHVAIAPLTPSFQLTVSHEGARCRPTVIHLGSSSSPPLKSETKNN